MFLSPFVDGPIHFNTGLDGKQIIQNMSRYGRSFSIVRVPYALKLLIQELQVMNIQMRIITEDNIDQLMSMSYSDNANKLLQNDSALPDLFNQYKNNLSKTTREANDIIYRKAPGANFEKPELPTFTPSSPEYAPASPDYPPPSPQYNPNTPPYAPGSPQYNPNTPPYAPGSPQYNPNTPPYTATSPQYNPNTPPYASSSPAYAPGSPAYAPDRPQYNPNTPLYAPGSPAYAPNVTRFIPSSPDYSPPSSSPDYPSSENTSSQGKIIPFTVEEKPNNNILEIEEEKVENEKIGGEIETNNDDQNNNGKKLINFDIKPEILNSGETKQIKL